MTTERHVFGADPGRTPSSLSSRPTYQDFFDAAWVGSFFRPLLIALVAASVVGGPLALLHLFGAPWRLGYVLPFAFVVALEGVYSTLQLGRPSWRVRRGMAFRLGEIVVLLALFRLAVWTFGTGWPDWTTVQLWLRQPSAFLDAQFSFLGFWILVVWALAIGITSDFLDLALQPDEIAARERHAWGESRSQLRVGRPMARSDILARFVARWTAGGLLLVFFASLSRMDMAILTTNVLHVGVRSLSLPPELLASLLCYFLAGLLLISQARLAVLRGRWYNQDLEVQPLVLRRWHVNSLLVVLAIGVVAAFLPMGTTSWLAAGVEFLLTLIMRLGYLLMFLLTLLLALLLWPLRHLVRTEAVAPPPVTGPLQLPTQAELVSRLPDWLGGAVLWLIVGLVAVYLGLSYLSAHGLLTGRPLAWLLRLRYWWRSRWARIGAAFAATTAAIGRRLRLARPRLRVNPGLPRVRVSALTPRERVRYFYLRMVGYAAAHGLARAPQQTPAEFAQALETAWPDAEADVEVLTAAFEIARYDRRPIPPAEAQGVQAVWRRLMRGVRGRASR